jgi:hypothetical protein
MKITTIVPAFKHQYLPELLGSLLHQTVRPHKVLLSDDSPDGAFTRLLACEPLAGLASALNVTVVPGPRTGAFANWHHALHSYGGDTELFHLLCDDDIVYPSFYERHLHAHAQGRFGVTVSRRWTALEGGQPVRDLPVPAAVAEHPSHLLALSPGVLFQHTCGRGANWLGEVSNAVFRAERARHIMRPEVDGVGYLGLEDIGAFLCTSLDEPVGYINDHLGYFRTSAHQASQQHFGRPLKLAHGAYIGLSIIGHRAGHLSTAQLRYAVLAVGSSVLQHYAEQDDLQPLVAALRGWMGGTADGEDSFLQAWHAYAGQPWVQAEARASGGAASSGTALALAATGRLNSVTADALACP